MSFLRHTSICVESTSHQAILERTTEAQYHNAVNVTVFHVYFWNPPPHTLSVRLLDLHSFLSLSGSGSVKYIPIRFLHHATLSAPPLFIPLPSSSPQRLAAPANHDLLA